MGEAIMIRKITRDKPLKILGFTDTHLSTGRESDLWTLRLIRETAAAEKADLILFVGDNVAGPAQSVRAFTEFMTEIGLPWCPVLGNHEGEHPKDTSRAETAAIFKESPCCMIPPEMPKTADGVSLFGHTNYAVPLCNDSGEVCHKLIFLDGGNEMSDADKVRLGCTHPPRFPYDFLKESQIEWYREEVRKDDCPSMVFCHIALPEFREFAEAGNFLFGEKRESVCSSLHNSGMFKAMCEEGRTVAFVAGHDHVNDFHILHEGIRLMYNRASGLSAYNMISQKVSEHSGVGCTVYTVDYEGNVTFRDLLFEDYFPEYRDEIHRVIRK